MPELSADARKQLLIHQFLAGLPVSLIRRLRASGNTANLDELVERAKILMVVDSGERQTAAVYFGTSEVSELKSQIQELTAQVAALKSDKNQPQCYYCKQFGHVQRYCQTESENADVLLVVGQATLLPTAGSRETRRGYLWGATDIPSTVSNSPTNTVVVATTKIQTAIITGSIGHSRR